jgi:hypothetical protein
LCVAGHFERDSFQADQRLEKTLCFPQALVKLEADVTHRFDHLIPILERVAVFLPLFGLPVFENLRLDPKIDLASIH